MLRTANNKKLNFHKHIAPQQQSNAAQLYDKLLDLYGAVSSLPDYQYTSVNSMSTGRLTSTQTVTANCNTSTRCQSDSDTTCGMKM